LLIERFLELTDQQGIKPAKYMHRFYWVTIVNVKSVNSGSMVDLIEWSYLRATQSLPKREQKKRQDIFKYLVANNPEVIFNDSYTD
jgi:predicted DNA-binding protein (MmcQ/YjbR family)